MNKDLNLILEGKKKIDWAKAHMHVLNMLERKFKEEKPFEELKIGAAIHLESNSAYLAITLAKGGARVAITGSNPLSTQDDVAAALGEEVNVEVFAKHGIDREGFYENYEKVLEIEPNLIVDDGADLSSIIHKDRPELLKDLIGICEETTSGVRRLRSMERSRDLKVPAIAVNDAKSKYLFDSMHGTGQSTWDGIIRTTNMNVAGSNVVVAGFGSVGKGITKRADGLGAKVTVTEVDPIRALEAAMEGYDVMPIEQAAKKGDFFISATGGKNVIGQRHFEKMKDGAILSNAGHFDVEINVEELKEMAVEVREVKENVEEYKIGDKNLYLLGEGRLVNLACADGHAAEIMDISFALQAKSALYLLESDLDNRVYNVPEEVDKQVSRLKLESMEIEIDELTEEQKEYLESWETGT